MFLKEDSGLPETALFEVMEAKVFLLSSVNQTYVTSFDLGF